MWRAEFVGAWAVMLLGIFITLFSLKYQFYTELGPGPGFLPLLLGIGILVGGMAEIVKVFRKKGRAEEKAFLLPRSKLGFRMLALIIIAFLLIPLLGISIGLALCTGSAMWFIGKHKLSACVLTAVASAVFIHFIFGVWLTIPLATGLIGW